MSTLNKDGIYTDISTGEPATSKEVKKSLRVTDYRRMVCCLAISAGVAILVIYCIAVVAEIARLKSENSAHLKNHMLLVSMLNTSLNQQQLQANSEVHGLIQQLNSSLVQLLMNQELLNSSIQINLMQQRELLDELQLLHIGQYKASPVSSCAALKDQTLPPQATTGSGRPMALLCVI
jgi:hypothetical protein